MAATLLLAACGSPATDQPSATPQPSSTDAPATPDATQEPTPSPSASPASPEGLERVLTAQVDGHYLSARGLVHGTGGYLAASEEFVGQEGGPSLVGRMFWRSADGRSWEEVESPLATDEWLQVLTTTRDGDFLLLSSVTAGEAGSGESRTIARRSADGIAWQEVDTGLPDSFQVFSVDHGARGSLLVGLQYLPGNDWGAWLSDDGVRWEEVLDLDERVRQLVFVQDGGAGDEGFVVAGSYSEGESHRYFALASADGHTWVNAEPEPFGEIDPQFRPDPWVTALGPDWVAAMHRRDGSVQFWRSANGLDWEESGVLDRGDDELNVFSPVFGAPDGRRLYFSTAGHGPFPASGNSGVWTSTDAQAWEPIAIEPPGYLGGVAVHDGVVVISMTHGPLEEAGSEFGIWSGPAD